MGMRMKPKSQAALDHHARLEVIRRLNDTLRTTGKGGTVVATPGLAALDPGILIAIVAAVRAFADFDTRNDPYGEHDFGVVKAKGKRVMWKIDYFDADLHAHSPDAADPTKTKRVMTIMLAEEY